MKKLVLLLGILGICNFSFGQIKKIEVGENELNTIGRVMYGSSFKNYFTKQELEKYNINNTIAYLAEYTYENKVIHKDIIGISNLVLSNEVQVRVNLNSMPCFEVSSISNEMALSLVKNNRWEFRPSIKGESICYNPGFLSTNKMELLVSNDYKTYNLIDLANGKIKIKLYRLEE